MASSQSISVGGSNFSVKASQRRFGLLPMWWAIVRDFASLDRQKPRYVNTLRLFSFWVWDHDRLSLMRRYFLALFVLRYVKVNLLQKQKLSPEKLLSLFSLFLRGSSWSESMSGVFSIVSGCCTNCNSFVVLATLAARLGRAGLLGKKLWWHSLTGLLGASRSGCSEVTGVGALPGWGSDLCGIFSGRGLDS